MKLKQCRYVAAGYVTSIIRAEVGGTDHTAHGVIGSIDHSKTSRDLIKTPKNYSDNIIGDREIEMLAGENDLAIHPPAASSEVQ
ncbi:MAG TPA: hypothetical protein VEL11_16020 [Candidatus Bathyarchaeia archaeon]|nr:hypothetical protein [Candidatus Bathyarchaeia archaeon]